MTGRIPVVVLGLSLGLFLVVTYVLCVLYGLLVTEQGMHQLLPMLLPGFTWLSWPSFLVGLAWAFAYGWYVAVVFAPIFNVLGARLDASRRQLQ